MPVKRVVRRQRWRELGVGIDGDRFAWCEFDADRDTQAAMGEIESQLGPFAEGYASELNPNYSPWFKALADSCAAAAVLIIDYGYERAQYYHAERRDGTLSCHYRQRVHFDPLIYPGLQDITAFVDFDAAADAAEAAGFEILGLVNQGHFLLANGLLDEAQQVSAAADQLQLLQVAQQVKTLTLPQEMGEKFKLLALVKNRSLRMPALSREAVLG
jgi:SAM-dependent MidA family methyltransferase